MIIIVTIDYWSYTCILISIIDYEFGRLLAGRRFYCWISICKKYRTFHGGRRGLHAQADEENPCSELPGIGPRRARAVGLFCLVLVVLHGFLRVIRQWGKWVFRKAGTARQEAVSAAASSLGASAGLSLGTAPSSRLILVSLARSKAEPSNGSRGAGCTSEQSAGPLQGKVLRRARGSRRWPTGRPWMGSHYPAVTRGDQFHIFSSHVLPGQTVQGTLHFIGGESLAQSYLSYNL